jgi:hypothetical protein
MSHPVIQQEIVIGRQSAEFTEVSQYGPHRLRVRIDRDSYDFQSSAKIEKWDGTKWQEVASRHYSQMKTPERLCYRPEPPTLADFKDDRDYLLKVGREIVR